LAHRVPEARNSVTCAACPTLMPLTVVRTGPFTQSRAGAACVCAIAVSAAWLLAASPLSAQPARPVSFAPDPAASQRETVRAQILAEEENAERSRLAAAIRRMQERVVAGDAQGVDDARAAIARHEAALRSLGREIAAMQKAAAPGVPSQPVNAPRPAPQPASDAAPPWWDVYTDRGRTQTAGSVPVPASTPRP
jgi:hypothetical protein